MSRPLEKYFVAGNLSQVELYQTGQVPLTALRWGRVVMACCVDHALAIAAAIDGVPDDDEGDACRLADPWFQSQYPNASVVQEFAPVSETPAGFVWPAKRPATASERASASRARRLERGQGRQLGVILPAEAAAALDSLQAGGYAPSATACIARALLDAVSRAERGDV